MSRAALSFLAVAALSAAALTAVAAAEECYGLDAARVCVTPNNMPVVEPTGGEVSECVHVGSSCKPVSVPVPRVSRDPKGGSPVLVGCYVGATSCRDAIDEIPDHVAPTQPGGIR